VPFTAIYDFSRAGFKNSTISRSDAWDKWARLNRQAGLSRWGLLVQVFPKDCETSGISLYTFVFI